MAQAFRLAAALCLLPSLAAAVEGPVATAPDPNEIVLKDYYIAPGDTLRIAVWKEPDLTAEVFVRLDGRVTVPWVGDVMAAGRTPEQLTGEVRDRLKALLAVPVVTVTVTQATSARFYMLGEVARPGTYPLTNRTTALQALALSGGFREFAKRDQVLIIRDRRGQRSSIRVNFREINAGLKLEQNVVIESGDTIIVP
jgi:polysaccharide biosynthesis/export protein